MNRHNSWFVKDCFTIIFTIMLLTIYFKQVYNQLYKDPSKYSQLWFLDNSEVYPIYMKPKGKLINI